MGDPKAFLHIRRADPKRLPIAQRTSTWQEFYEPVAEETLRAQGARCMDCGVPFCQGDTGCPVQNVIPDWNDLVYRGRWQEALDALHATNNFPEFTGRLCPAPCESACVLGLVDRPVSIRSIEQSIADRGFARGWITPLPPARETGKRVAVIGSGPAGLAAAQDLRRLGHAVVVYEKADRPGGLLRYGIPDFKMEKAVLDRRLEQLEAEGVTFACGIDVGVDLPVRVIREWFDAVVLAVGAEAPRDIAVPGRTLAGVHYAMDFLTQQNRRLAGDAIPPGQEISARGKHVVVVGGGDTGSDCVGTCHRQGAADVLQVEINPRPPVDPDPSTPWPQWPRQLRTSHAHEEGGRRDWGVMTTAFSGEDGRVRHLHAVRAEPTASPELHLRFAPVPGTEWTMRADLVLLAMGFAGPSKSALLSDLGVRLDARGTVATSSARMTSVDGIFAAGDARRGASLIVWAIREGREAARGVDAYLKTRSSAASASTLARPRQAVVPM